jgi:FKBP-type peptidyl-prolyl cis-trans isomerase
MPRVSSLLTCVFLGLGCLLSTPAVASEVLESYYRTPSNKAQTTETGLSYQVLKKGRGRLRPTETATVMVHYTGWLASDGRKFDSSVDRGIPATFPLDRVIPGWTEGVQTMRVNELTRFWIPAELAYGNGERPGTPVGDLIFDVKLLGIKPGPEPIAIATPPMKPPKRATTTPSGLAYQTIKRGRGGRYPQADDTVLIHYSGWEASNGELFDSSVRRGSPMPLPLKSAVDGLVEGLMLMVEGQRTRFWLPPELAYGAEALYGGPSGVVVYEIELLKIQ